MITLLVRTDGRDHIYETIPSALDNLHGPITRKLIYDDSGDPLNRHRLAEAFPEFVITYSANGRQGFGGAIRFMWRYLAQNDHNSYIFDLEDDFLFQRDVDLDAMIHVLEQRPELVQLALRRQAWNDQERAAGGVVELAPDSYVDCHDGTSDWLEHSNFWTTNPSLYRRSLCQIGWPEDPRSEGAMTVLARERGARFGYWGARDVGPWVNHIGRERVGCGY